MSSPRLTNASEGINEDAEKKRFDYPWLSDLDSTLNDVEGSKAFESYLVRCGMFPLLEFIWACEGMKSLVNENPDKCDQLVSCIYKNYIISGALHCLSNKVVLDIARCLEAHFEKPEPSGYYPAKMMSHSEPTTIDLNIFDEAKKEVETCLKNSAFPRFQHAVQVGDVCVGESKHDLISGADEKGSLLRNSKSKLASHPEAFARALCEKLEGLKMSRNKN